MQLERTADLDRWAAQPVSWTVCEHRHEDVTVPDGEALHAYPITQEHTFRLHRRAFAVTHREQVDERAAAARVDEDHCRRVGDQVTVEVAESDQVLI